MIKVNPSLWMNEKSGYKYEQNLDDYDSDYDVANPEDTEALSC